MKKFVAFLVCLLLFSSVAFSAFADDLSGHRYMIDSAGVLSEQNAAVLENELQKFSEKYDADFVIVTAKNINSCLLMDYADNYYDTHNYKKDGLLLLVGIYDDGSYERGNSYISTSGKCIKTIGNEEISKIGNKVTGMLIGGDYAHAFETAKDEVESEMDLGRLKKIGILIAAMLVVGLLSGLIYTNSLKRQLKSVFAATDADNYLVGNSLVLKGSFDHYLYSNVVRTEKPKSDSNGTHTSSSGNTHGGGGF